MATHTEIDIRRGTYTVTDDRGNIVSRVVARKGDGEQWVEVQGEGDHPQTRRARARRALREVFPDADVDEYIGATLMTHVNSQGEPYGSLHRYLYWA